MLAPWKKSYGKPRQHIIKQRHYSANKGPSSQSYCVFSSHIWMWELEYKENWALQNWYWSWNANTLATWCEELTHLKRPWCWERLKAGGGGDEREWDGWMASPTRWTWVWVNSGSWWWTGKPAVLQSMELQRVGHNWVTELNWTWNFKQRIDMQKWNTFHIYNM